MLTLIASKNLRECPRGKQSRNFAPAGEAAVARGTSCIDTIRPERELSGEYSKRNGFVRRVMAPARLLFHVANETLTIPGAASETDFSGIARRAHLFLENHPACGYSLNCFLLPMTSSQAKGSEQESTTAPAQMSELRPHPGKRYGLVPSCRRCLIRRVEDYCECLAELTGGHSLHHFEALAKIQLGIVMLGKSRPCSCA